MGKGVFMHVLRVSVGHRGRHVASRVGWREPGTPSPVGSEVEFLMANHDGDEAIHGCSSLGDTLKLGIGLCNDLESLWGRGVGV